MNRLVFLLVAAVLFVTAASASEPRYMSMVTHNSVEIDASAENIWPLIVDPREWKAGLELVPVSGDPAKTGARFQAEMPDNPGVAVYYIVNVEFTPPGRRTIRLDGVDGSLIGFASWELTELGGKTRVAYHVYSRSTVPDNVTISDKDLAQQAEQARQSNSVRFDAELKALKKLVEEK